LAQFDLGKYPEARASFERSLEIRRRLGDYWQQAMCLNNLGKVATDQGDFESATRRLASAQALFETIDSPDVSVVFLNQGHAFLRQGQALKALPILVEALELTRETEKSIPPGGLCDIYLLIAEANVGIGDLDWAQDALKNVEDVGNPVFVARALATRARIHQAQGDLAKARMAYKRALDMFELVGSPAGLLRTQLHYARCLAAQGWKQSAIEVEQQARAEAARIGLHL
jgi:tetratricopeptide (TPR) repeat protein